MRKEVASAGVESAQVAPWFVEVIGRAGRCAVRRGRFRIGGGPDHDLVVPALGPAVITLLFLENGEIWWGASGAAGEILPDVPFEVAGLRLVATQRVDVRDLDDAWIDEEPTDPCVDLTRGATPRPASPFGEEMPTQPSFDR